MTQSRREFIQISGAGFGAAVAGSGLVTKWWGLDGDVVHDPGTDGDNVVPTFCELCFWKCGVLAHVKNGRVTKIVGNPEHPLSKGRLCPRGTGGTGLLYDPDRLKTPLLRKTGKRGDQTFEEVSWEKALDFTAEKLLKIQKECGPDKVALFSHGNGGSFFKHLLFAYGSGNVTAPSYGQCRGPREVGFQLTFGSPVGSPEALDIGNSRCLTLMGSHLGENMHNTQVQDFARAIANGATVIVVDPRFSTAAGKARHWLPIKPGTDLALLLAWMHVIVAEGLYDREYVEKHTTGFPELEKHLADKTPEWAFTETTIRPEVIVETARVIAGARPASLVHPGRHTTWYGDDTQRSRAVAILNALLGSWGRRGGFFIPSSMPIPKTPVPAYAQKPKTAQDHPDGVAYPFADEVLSHGVCDATIPGRIGGAGCPIKGWIVYGTNLLQALPQRESVLEAIQKLDLLVAIDVLPAEITGYADVVLPEATYLERWDDIASTPWREPFLAVRQPVVPPLLRKQARLVDREGARQPHGPRRVLPVGRRRHDGRGASRRGRLRRRGDEIEGRSARQVRARDDRGRARSDVCDALEEDRALLQADGGGRPRAPAALHAASGARPGAVPSAVRTNPRPHVRAHDEQPVPLRGHARKPGLGELEDGEGARPRGRRTGRPGQSGRRQVHAGGTQGNAAHPPRLRLRRARIRPRQPRTPVREGARARRQPARHTDRRRPGRRLDRHERQLRDGGEGVR